MRILLYFGLAIVISNCSFNQDSKYWTEDSIKKKVDNQKLIKIIEKSKDVMNSYHSKSIEAIDDLKSHELFPTLENINNYLIKRAN